MKWLNIFMVGTFFSIVTAQAETKYNVLIGGADYTPEKAIFDNHLEPIAQYLNSDPAIKYDYVYDSQYKNTVQILEKNFQKAQSKSDLNSETMDAMIKRYIVGIRSGKIIKGDQIALMILSHGDPRAKNNTTEVSHSISYNKEGSFTGSYSLDNLQALQKVAKEAGIKLAIIDSSCRSGNSLNLSDGHTCIISSTSDKLFGYFRNSDTFAHQFYSRMKKGKNLESLFLEARSQSVDQGFPRINTKKDQQIYQTYFEKIFPFMLSIDPQVTLKRDGGLEHYLENSLYMDALCAQRTQTEELLNFIKKFEKDSQIGWESRWRLILGEHVFEDLRKNIKIVQAEKDLIRKDL